MRDRWENAVEPCLEIFAARSCESCSRKLLRVEAERNLLRRVLSYRESALSRLGSKATILELLPGLAQAS